MSTRSAIASRWVAGGALILAVWLTAQVGAVLAAGPESVASSSVAQALPTPTPFRFLTPTPFVPTYIIPTTISGSQVHLSWVDNSNIEDGFQVQYREHGQTTYQTAPDTIATTATNARLRLISASDDGSHGHIEVDDLLCDLANALSTPTNTLTETIARLPNPIDPRGLLTFGVAGLGLFVLSWLIRRSGHFPRGPLQRSAAPHGLKGLT